MIAPIDWLPDGAVRLLLPFHVTGDSMAHFDSRCDDSGLFGGRRTPESATRATSFNNVCIENLQAANALMVEVKACLYGGGCCHLNFSLSLLRCRWIDNTHSPQFNPIAFNYRK